MRPLRVVRSASHDVKFNLALEDFIWSERKRNALESPQHVMYLWQNEPCVIVGRHQNPHSECHLARMQDDDVVLARRKR
jgi:lipoate-protein ligase A